MKRPYPDIIFQAQLCLMSDETPLELVVILLPFFLAT